MYRICQRRQPILELAEVAISFLEHEYVNMIRLTTFPNTLEVKVCIGVPQCITAIGALKAFFVQEAIAVAALPQTKVLPGLQVIWIALTRFMLTCGVRTET
jgi:hypothetical protein